MPDGVDAGEALMVGEGDSVWLREELALGVDVWLAVGVCDAVGETLRVSAPLAVSVKLEDELAEGVGVGLGVRRWLTVCD